MGIFTLVAVTKLGWDWFQTASQAPVQAKDPWDSYTY